MKILHNAFTYIVSKTHVEFCEYELFYLLYHNLVILFFIFHGHPQLWITPQRSKLSPNSIQWLLRYRLKTSVCIYKSQAQEIIPQDQCKHHQKLLYKQQVEVSTTNKSKTYVLYSQQQSRNVKEPRRSLLNYLSSGTKKQVFQNQKPENLYLVCIDVPSWAIYSLFLHFYPKIHCHTYVIHTHTYIYTHIY